MQRLAAEVETVPGEPGVLDTAAAGRADLLGAADPWWVVHTRARHEKALAATLARLGVRHYLPVVRRVRMHGRRRVVVDFPLFPGYLFLAGQGRECEVAWRTRRVARILPVVDQDRFRVELDAIRRVVESERAVGVYPGLREGSRCRVTGGALRGVEGVVVRRGRSCRLLISVTILGQSAVVDIDGMLVEPIG